MPRIAALGLVLLVAAGCVSGPGGSGALTPSGSARPASPVDTEPSPSVRSASPTSSTSVWSPPPVPVTVHGRAVETVSQAIADRDSGRAGSGSFMLGGYWTVRSTLASCPAPMETPAEIEAACSSIVAGITERYEAMNTFISGVQSSTTRGPDGPSLVPYVPPNLRDRLINALMSPGRDAPPIPIVVAGHFDDPLAQQCRPESRDACRARFAIETVVVFDPAAAPSATPQPSPTPFPSPAPSGLFAPQQCNGDVPYSFVGWTTPAELHSDLQGEGHIWAVVTRDVVLIGDWFEGVDAAGQLTGHFSRGWARRVCTGQLQMGNGIRYGVIMGTGFVEWDDGRRTRADPFGPGTGDASYPPAGPLPSLPPGVKAEMQGPGIAPAKVTIHDWSGVLGSARPATDAELAAPGAETGQDHAAAARVLDTDPRSVVIVWAECGSDSSATVVITKDRGSVLIKGAPRTDCGQPGARRGVVFTFTSPVPSGIEAITGL